MLRGRVARGYNEAVRNLALLALLLLLWPTSAGAADLSVGDVAPPFTLAGSDGKQYSLAEILKANQGAVLAWFPKAFTPG